MPIAARPPDRPPPRGSPSPAWLLDLAALRGPRPGCSPTGWRAANAPTPMNRPSPTAPDQHLVDQPLARAGEKTPFSSGSAMGDTSVYLGQKGWEKTKSAPDPDLRGRVRRRQEAVRRRRPRRSPQAPHPPGHGARSRRAPPGARRPSGWKAETEFKMPQIRRRPRQLRDPHQEVSRHRVRREARRPRIPDRPDLARPRKTPRSSRWTGSRTSTAAGP